jgi:DNA-binding Lrp family transcriptional regulator
MGITSLKSAWTRIWGRYPSSSKQPGQNEGIKSFKENQKIEEAVDQRDLGFREIPLEKIVGSVGRYRDFDSRFRLRKGLPPERLERIKEAIRAGKPLPPVLLYRIKDDYYVLDGNHRVSAAKEFGWSSIEARIIEYLPSNETLENIIYREKADFERETGLFDVIELTEVGQYPYLLKQITEHKRSLEKVNAVAVTFEKAARDWFDTIYRPLAAIIESSELSQAFPNRTLSDLYAYISFHQWQKGRKREYGIGLDELVPKSMEKFRAKIAEKDGVEIPEMKRTTAAYLLINVETRREDRIMEKLFDHREVQEVHFVPGEFDIITKIVVESDWLSSESEVIGQFVQQHVRSIPGVTKTQTIIPISSKRKKHPDPEKTSYQTRSGSPGKKRK